MGDDRGDPMKKAQSQELADRWLRRAPAGAGKVRDYVADGLENLISDDEPTAVAVLSHEEWPEIVILQGDRVSICRAEPDEWDNGAAVDIEVHVVDRANSVLTVRRGPFVEERRDGLIATLRKHSWRLVSDGLQLAFDGAVITSGSERGPDELQRLGVALAAVLSWEIPAPRG